MAAGGAEREGSRACRPECELKAISDGANPKELFFGNWSPRFKSLSLLRAFLFLSGFLIIMITVAKPLQDRYYIIQIGNYFNLCDIRSYYRYYHNNNI